MPLESESNSIPARCTTRARGDRSSGHWKAGSKHRMCLSCCATALSYLLPYQCLLAVAGPDVAPLMLPAEVDPGVVPLMLPVGVTERALPDVLATSDPGVAGLMLPVDVSGQVFAVVLVDSDPEVVPLVLLVPLEVVGPLCLLRGGGSPPP